MFDHGTVMATATTEVDVLEDERNSLDYTIDGVLGSDPRACWTSAASPGRSQRGFGSEASRW
jgi:hypothetical protein